ncbi:Crp/Fnr family transcriptional regulator [Desertibacillus haloalkaliphilus]|uniref:Crp/Fnr family transcriptional regulator n=1 Tax=Desertibacillus haloalkaliphilus TaxID=1328930 RepID=UPI001C26EFE5|nr:Crp/Fnr family transcriptional regulator [Desertibacillus haloalkaliphilus]MBU8907197.1 Crp/Fnr family transcriptional regulator [Desertibacillus haloalkaliphilus]
MLDWVPLLKKMEFFQGLTQEEIQPLLQNAIEKTYEDKEVLFSEGDKRDYLFVLRKGTVLISKLSEEGEERVINILTSGEIFPHTGFFDDRPYPGTAQAKREVEVLKIPMKAFDTFIEANPHLAFRVIKVMSRKIYDLQHKLNNMLSLNVEERLLTTIEQLNTLGEDKINLTHQEIANVVGASRETVSRQLKKLEKQGKIKMLKHSIVICDNQ